MRQFLLPAVFAAGALCGAALVAVASWMNAGDGAKAITSLDSLNTPQLGAEMMRRVGETFVWDSRKQYPLEYGPTFYDIPKPWGDWACRVDRYELTADIVAGRPSRTPFHWDPLKVQRLYGLWAKPTGPSATPEEHREGCRAFRDFDNLMSEKTILSAARAYYVTDIIKDAISSDQVTFTLTCSGANWPCEAAQKLKGLDLRMLRHVKMTSERWERDLGYALRTDEIQIAGPKDGLYYYTVTVDSKQMFGQHSVDEAVVLAADVKEEVRPFTPTAPPTK